MVPVLLELVFLTLSLLNSVLGVGRDVGLFCEQLGLSEVRRNFSGLRENCDALLLEQGVSFSLTACGERLPNLGGLVQGETAGGVVWRTGVVRGHSGALEKLGGVFILGDSAAT